MDFLSPDYTILFPSGAHIISAKSRQTKRQFGTVSLKEHQKAISLSKGDNSALLEHTWETNHMIAWDNSKTLL